MPLVIRCVLILFGPGIKMKDWAFPKIPGASKRREDSAVILKI